MAREKVDRRTFIELLSKHGVTRTARMLQTDKRGVDRRRRRMELLEGLKIEPPTKTSGGFVRKLDDHPAFLKFTIEDGYVLVGSDAHYWPGTVTTAHRAFVAFAERFQPSLVVMNGDVMDFPSISRFSPSSWVDWENRPSVADEIETAGKRLDEIRQAAPNAELAWPLGNHDGRFESRIATAAPELARTFGTHLKDHFPHWRPCWGVSINDFDLVIKHRIRGGVYAPRNNTLASGKSTFTGHAHSLKVWAHSDYGGTRFSADTGTLAEPYGDQFLHYTEGNPVDWRSGFILARYKAGELLWPEVVHVRGPGVVEFRGDTFTI